MRSTHVRSLVPVIAAMALVAVSVSGTEPDRVPIDPARELVLTDPSVIDSPEETTFNPVRRSGTHKQGAWSFGRLVHNMLPAAQRNSSAAASQLVMNWLKTWETDQSPNPGVSPARARPSIRTLITSRWKAASGCSDPESPATDALCVLDMAQAPFRLSAIVNRPDLRLVANDGTAIGGEGRFVFQVLGPTLGVSAATGELEIMDEAITPQKFTVIFEYSLPVARSSDTLVWARRWHDLGSLSFGAEFNSTLRALTNAFSGPDADVRRVNGNALNQLRTNEVALMGARFPQEGFVAARQFWELREFHLTQAGLTPQTVHLEPSRDFDIPRTGHSVPEGTRHGELDAFLVANADAVLTSSYRFPDWMNGNSALVGSAPYGAWGKLTNPNPPTIASQGVPHQLGGTSIGVRDQFAMNTCAGCHRHETDTRHFLHITTLAAIEPLSRVDDRARIGVVPGTPESATVLSNALSAEIGPGGTRFEDFKTLLMTAPGNLKNKTGIRVCAR